MYLPSQPGPLPQSQFLPGSWPAGDIHAHHLEPQTHTSAVDHVTAANNSLPYHCTPNKQTLYAITGLTPADILLVDLYYSSSRGPESLLASSVDPELPSTAAG